MAQPRNSPHTRIRIRIGAAHYDCTLNTPDGPVHYDLAAMPRRIRNSFIAQFVEAFRLTSQGAKT